MQVQANHLQGNINNSESWAGIWRMFFKYKKCKKFHVGNKDINAIYVMHDQGQPVSLEQAEVEKDLGVYFDSKLTFRDHITKKVNTHILQIETWELYSDHLLTLIKKYFYNYLNLWFGLT